MTATQTLYLDCFSGIAGNMVLGALVDLGVDPAALERDLSSLPVSGYRLDVRKVTKRGIAATYVEVEVIEPQPERHLRDIVEVVESNSLPEPVRMLAIRIFRRLAEAEAKIHGVAIDRVHFHEVGAVDAIVDVVGAAIGLHRLGVERVICSPLNVGGGSVQMAHGRYPVPGPATLELLKGAPIYADATRHELVTPTGAAICSTIAASFGPMPSIEVASIGYGAGSADFDHPNVLRAVLGRSLPDRLASPVGDLWGDRVELPATDRVVLLETNLDDMNPQFCEYVIERLLEAGALDVRYTPTVMKKGRPALLLSAIAPPAKTDELIAIILAETTTLGVRVAEVERRCLDREIQTVETPYGAIRIKIGKVGDRVLNLAPEYEDVKRAARETNTPIKLVYDAAKRAFDGQA